jgi:hypothetical protein
VTYPGLISASSCHVRPFKLLFEKRFSRAAPAIVTWDAVFSIFAIATTCSDDEKNSVGGGMRSLFRRDRG